MFDEVPQLGPAAGFDGKLVVDAQPPTGSARGQAPLKSIAKLGLPLNVVLRPGEPALDRRPGIAAKRGADLAWPLRTAKATGMPIDRLIFEFTENEHMGSPEHVALIIDTYKRIGFAVAIDDFGAGSSGLDMFARFTPDEIKLDLELIRGIDSDARRRAIVRSMVHLCEELDTLLIAEEVEWEAEARTLREIGVRYHQGYWYARPALGQLPGLQKLLVG